METGNQALDAVATLARRPELIVDVVWDTVTNIPQSVRDGVLEGGTSIGEGSAVAADAELRGKLSAIYGENVSAGQIATLATRIVGAILSAVGVGKVPGAVNDAAKGLVARKIDDTRKALDSPDTKAADARIPDADRSLDLSPAPDLPPRQQSTLVPTHRASLLITNHRAPQHIAKQLADTAEEVELPIEFTLTRDALYVRARPGAPTAPSIDGKPPLPMPEGLGSEPVAMYLAAQRTENQRYSHISGWLEEARLAQRVHQLPDQQVVRWGGKAVIQGEDVISVNPRTVEVTLWDSKFRSGASRIADSPTYDSSRPRYGDMLRSVEDAIAADPSLSADVKRKAIQNVSTRQFRECTAGAGNALNSICK